MALPADVVMVRRAVPFRMRLKRRRTHIAMERTGQNQKTGQADKRTDGRTNCSIALSPPLP